MRRRRRNREHVSNRETEGKDRKFKKIYIQRLKGQHPQKYNAADQEKVSSGDRHFFAEVGGKVSQRLKEG